MVSANSCYGVIFGCVFPFFSFLFYVKTMANGKKRVHNQTALLQKKKQSTIDACDYDVDVSKSSFGENAFRLVLALVLPLPVLYWPFRAGVRPRPRSTLAANSDKLCAYLYAAAG